MGDPKGLDEDDTKSPPYEELQWNTHTAYSDLDASPTKAWMIHHRSEPKVKTSFRLGFGKRPYEELYDLDKDPDYMKNLAGEESYSKIKQQLHMRLMDVLKKQKDPRIVEKPCRFEHTPYAGELTKIQMES
jgi:uncharacterized sulfatase